MDEKTKKLAAYMLEMASDEFGNHGCNDVDEKVWNGWSIEERKEFVKNYHIWNGDPEEFDENFLHLQDHAIMSFLADRLKNNN